MNVTLEYSCYVGLQAASNKVAAVSGVVLDEGEYEALGLQEVSDVTAADATGNTVTRTVELEQTAYGLTIATTAQQLIDLTTNLFTDKLSLRIPAEVTAATPVVT